ncbi:MAG: DUF1028 domain-containing protein [Rhodospirillales bacterium]|nr:DUF1028 domain-containing protein [Rhodospirillales bacterium]
MAFAVIARCPRTSQIGGIVCANVMASGARVLHCAHGIGAVLTQNRADARLGARGLDLLAAGHDAQQTIDTLVASTPHAHWRQLAVLDAGGKCAAFTGARCGPETSEAPARDACALGSFLASALVAPAMLRALLADPALPLAERLMAALEAGLAAGGIRETPVSAALKVSAAPGLPLVDLRIDDDPAPVAALRALWGRFAPIAAEMLLRATDPDNPAVQP